MFDKDLIHDAGSIPGAGVYKCTVCGNEITINDGEALPTCPTCRNDKFRQMRDKKPS